MTFVRTDLSLLEQRYCVREWYQRTRAVNVAALTRALTGTDIVVGWFASWHTLLPTLLARALHKPALLIVGGYDTAAMSEIGYGSQRGGIKRLVARLAMRGASSLIAFSEFSRQQAICNSGVDPKRICTIYLGVEQCRNEAPVIKEPRVITVGNVDRVNLARKGLEPFVRAAALLPGTQFVLIGAQRDGAIEQLRAIATPNVEFTGWVTETVLRDYLARAKVYVQASLHEGFGLSAAEAMACECIPVVTRAGSLPEIVGETGVYIDAPSAEAVAAGVRQALTLDAGCGHRASARIAHEFPLERRREKLTALIDMTLSPHG